MSRLAAVKKARLNQPRRFLIYGGEGTGKTTLAADAPDPIFLDIEDGSGELAVARYSFRDGPGGHVPHTYEEVLGAIADLTNNPHAFRTLVIDTADSLEALMWAHIVKRDHAGEGTIEDFGYGKGYNIAVDEWRGLAHRLNRLRTARQMAIIILAHTQIRTFKNPDAADYDRYQLRVHDKAGGFLKEWADVTGFVMFESGAKAEKKGARAKGWTTNRRLLKLQRDASFDAKSRIPLPAEVELDIKNPWAPLAAAVAEFEDTSAADLRTAIEAEIARLADTDLTPKVRAAVTAAKDNTEELGRYLAELRNREPKQQQQSNAAA